MELGAELLELIHDVHRLGELDRVQVVAGNGNALVEAHGANFCVVGVEV